MNGQGLELKVFASQGMVDVRTPFTERDGDFVVSLILGAYKGPNDAICSQVNNPAMQADIEKLGCQIADALRDFGLKHPESGILHPRSIELNQLIYGDTMAATPA